MLGPFHPLSLSFFIQNNLRVVVDDNATCTVESSQMKPTEQSHRLLKNKSRKIFILFFFFIPTFNAFFLELKMENIFLETKILPMFGFSGSLLLSWFHSFLDLFFAASFSEPKQSVLKQAKNELDYF